MELSDKLILKRGDIDMTSPMTHSYAGGVSNHESFQTLRASVFRYQREYLCTSMLMCTSYRSLV